MDSDLSVENLARNHGIKAEAIMAVYDLAMMFHGTGWAADAAELLLFFTSITDLQNMEAKESSARWGKLACNISAKNWSAVSEDMLAVRETLDSDCKDIFEADLAPYAMRTQWVLHWGLFAYFKPDKPLTNFFVDMVIDNTASIYQKVIETSAPHLLRYLTAAVIINRKKRFAMRRVIKMVDQNLFRYSDAFTDFLHVAALKRDFNGSLAALKNLEAVIDADFFLHDLKEEIMKNAMKLIFEDYVKTHKSVSVTFIAEKTGQSVKDAEVWVANLVSEMKEVAKISCKIDSVSQCATVFSDLPTAHKRITDTMESIDRPTAE